MATPTAGHLRLLKRVGRYLVGAPRVVWEYAWQEPVATASVFSDSDWAGCRVTARSTSGGALLIGRHCLRTYSVTQKFVTLSSAEAELMALVKAATEAIGLSQLSFSWGVPLEATLYVDSSAALAVTQRRGVGRLRHVRIGHFWVQEAQASGELKFKKVLGSCNPADLMTKYLSAPKAGPLCDRLAQFRHDGNAEARLQLRALGSSIAPQGHLKAIRAGTLEPCCVTEKIRRTQKEPATAATGVPTATARIPEDAALAVACMVGDEFGCVRSMETREPRRGVRQSTGLSPSHAYSQCHDAFSKDICHTRASCRPAHVDPKHSVRPTRC